MPGNRKPVFLLAGCCVLLFASAQAEVYKWVDEKGVVNYSQTSPDAGNYESVNTRLPDVDDQAARERLERLTKNLDEARSARERKKIESRRESEKVAFREAACRKARDRLFQLESRPHVLFTDSDGSVSRLPEEERQKRIGTTRQYIGENCTAMR